MLFYRLFLILFIRRVTGAGCWDLRMCRNANKYYVLASTTMLVYDHILTFDEELTYMWRRKKSFPFYLFLVFRYFTPVISIINIPALHSPRWVGSLCEDWIWIPVAVGPIVSLATGGRMLHRSNSETQLIA
ncbi:hypothetical protein PM082_018761 [Marasmius tenuissimus]|nr:hypothetical protein PM082_018761 [Marasmius tenuissimus]